MKGCSEAQIASVCAYIVEREARKWQKDKHVRTETLAGMMLQELGW
jgi:hypothetical protein